MEKIDIEELKDIQFNEEKNKNYATIDFLYEMWHRLPICDMFGWIGNTIQDLQWYIQEVKRLKIKAERYDYIINNLPVISDINSKKTAFEFRSWVSKEELETRLDKLIESKHLVEKWEDVLLNENKEVTCIIIESKGSDYESNDPSN